ncbi:putative nadh kinase pos5 protein [Zalerion maritima]|uniref:Nadh kinase pos5 protein n=1 Tax=Zalerion maritima TaxID=339359 RepID=A0AAD5RHP4_9PEZI|nr:putative nadh kinase pos5 protein [Zalerion maritima]
MSFPLARSLGALGNPTRFHKSARLAMLLSKSPSASRTVAAAATRAFSASAARREVLNVASLPPRLVPKYLHKSAKGCLLSLQWPQPPRNVLIIPKLHAPKVVDSAVAFAKHLHNDYPGVNLIFESRIASHVHETLPFPIYTSDPTYFPDHIDLVATLGGDGTILRAASLFSTQESVPPVLSFSMGTLGFLGEWKFEEYKRAWREVYMSGSTVAVQDLQGPHTQAATGARAESEQSTPEVFAGWENARGKNMGATRASKILLRHRLKVGMYDADGVNINEQMMPTATAEQNNFHHHLHPASEDCAIPHPKTVMGAPPAFHAINELLIHRGPHPHLAIIDIYLNNHWLTEAVADGILISTPTGSTAYSLSSGGSIIHPLVKSLLITPICPRSLSFRPLVLPLTTKVVLKLSERNRGRELEVSIDGKRRAGVGIGMEVRVEGEIVRKLDDGSWTGGVPCVIRGPGKGEIHDGALEDDDGWVVGLNGLLKFNYPFGEPPSGF